MRNSVEKSWKKTLSYRRFCLNLHGRRQAQRNRCHVWASPSSQTLDLSLNSTPSKNIAQKPAETVQYSIIRECVLWVTALTSYVTANSSNWEMQKQMDGTFLDLLPMCPRKRLRATSAPGGVWPLFRSSIWAKQWWSATLYQKAWSTMVTQMAFHSLYRKKGSKLHWIRFSPKRGTNNKYCSMQPLCYKYVML